MWALGLALALLGCQPNTAARAANEECLDALRLDVDMLIPGKGPTVQQAALVFTPSNGTILYAGAVSEAPTSVGEHIVAPPGSIAMPGLWDTHVHFTGQRSTALEELASLPPALAALRAGQDASLALQAGVTSVREVGGLGIHLKTAVQEGTLVGPRIYAAGSILSQTGGHGDVHSLPLHWLGEAASSLPDNFRLCDGDAECIRAAREQFRKGADFLKVCTSGGVLSALDDPLAAQFSPSELSAIVAEARRAGRIVAAHAHGRAGIQAAIDAGCHTIEHGSALDPETASQMASRGMILVPTRFAIMRVLQRAEQLSAVQQEKVRLIAETHGAAVRAALAANVTIALGTDIQTSGDTSMLPFGLHAQEMEFLMQLGMSALQVIESATANGPLTLGPRYKNVKSGQLLPGYDADFIMLDQNPLHNITVLSDPARVTQVWRGGKKLKDLSRE